LDLLCTLDAEGNVVSIGPRWPEELGWQEANLLQRPFGSLLAGAAQLPFTRALRGLGPDSASVELDGPVMDSAGRQRPCRWALELRSDGVVVALGRLQASQSSPHPTDANAPSSEALLDQLRRLFLSRDQADREDAERVARERQRLALALEELERRERESEVLRDSLEYLQTCDSLEEGLEVLGRQATRIFPAPVAVYRYEEVDGSFLPLEAGSSAEAAVSGASCWGVRTSRPHLSRAGALALSCRHGSLDAEQEMLCLPLLSDAVVLGLLVVGPAKVGVVARGGPAALRRQMLDFGVISRQFSLALRNVRLRERLQRQATEDALTGLANRREFERCLARELARWRRHQESFSLLVMDVDRFKELNDLHGHTQGDRFLETLAAGWQRMVRTEDCLARIGGDEFALLLVHADKEAAVEKAGALRAIARCWESEDRRPCTVSVGVAAVGVDGYDRDSLLRAADRALYLAKAAGRDRVVPADASAAGAEG